MTRRSAGAPTRRGKARSRPSRGPTVPPDAPQVGATGQPTIEEAGQTEAIEPEALVVTHGFDSGKQGEPYSATIRLTGRRVGARGAPKRRDSFVHEETVDGIVPGSGVVSVTSRVYGLEPGEWTVTADVIRPGIHAGDSRPLNRAGRFSIDPIPPAKWSWRRRSLMQIPASSVRTRWAMLAPLASMPAVIPGIWAVLGALGIVVALASQVLLLADVGVSVRDGLTVSVVAVVSGLIGAKLWYAVLHPRDSWQSRAQGWAVDGLLFVALIVAFGGLLVLDVPIGPYFDAVAPGLFFGVAIGRIGCFFAGCCSGRCTRSRWGIWSSDRRVGFRRIPTQLIESSAGAVLGVVTAVMVLGDLPIPSGLIFVSSFAAYIVFRQSLLRMRAERREFSWRRSRSAAGT